MIHKMSLLRHESPCPPLKIFKLLIKRDERSTNVGKIAVIFSHISGETLGALVRLVGMPKA